MSDIEHGKRCYDARLSALKLFWIARGHDPDEAHQFATRHMAGDNVPINEPKDSEATDSAVQ